MIYQLLAIYCVIMVLSIFYITKAPMDVDLHAFLLDIIDIMKSLSTAFNTKGS